MQSILAVSFLTIALICGSASISHLEAISQPSQGGGYPSYEPTTGATPDCLVTPKKYENSYHTGNPPPPPTLRTYSILECCKTAYSGPNLSTQTTTCVNYYEWKDQNYKFEHPPYGPPYDYISDWGYLPPYHAYIKSIVHGGENVTISPPIAVGPPAPPNNPGNNAGTLFSKPTFMNPSNNSTSSANSTSMNPSSNSTSMNPSSNSTSMNPSSNSTNSSSSNTNGTG